MTRRTVRRARRFPKLTPAPLDTDGLSVRDAALAHAIDQAVTRRWITLGRLVDACLDRGWEELQPIVQGPLLVGAAQLLFLDRIPDHAAINEAVNWMKGSARPKAAGLVNAVLRRVAELRGEIEPATAESDDAPDLLPLHDGRVMRLQRPVFEGSEEDRLAWTTSHPRALIDAWIARFGAESARRIARHSLVHAPVLVSGLDPKLAGVSPHDAPGFVVFEQDHANLVDLLAAHPEARVQDPTTAAAVQSTATLNPVLIIDACAGRGTKTGQLAALHEEATIVATDPDDDRRRTLAEVYADHPRVEVVEPGALAIYNARADLLLLDVPCSNTGVLARRLEAKYRTDEDTLASLVALQRQIIADSLPLLSDRGSLLYSTCSIDPRENEEQARWATKWHPLEISSMWSRLPESAPGDPPRCYADGGFFALLRRAAGDSRVQPPDPFREGSAP